MFDIYYTTGNVRCQVKSFIRRRFHRLTRILFFYHEGHEGHEEKLDADCADYAEELSHRTLRGWLHGRGVDGLVYTNSQPYSKRACAFGLRSLSKLLTLSALVKLEKNFFHFREDIYQNAQK